MINYSLKKKRRLLSCKFADKDNKMSYSNSNSDVILSMFVEEPLRWIVMRYVVWESSGDARSLKRSLDFRFSVLLDHCFVHTKLHLSLVIGSHFHGHWIGGMWGHECHSLWTSCRDFLSRRKPHAMMCLCAQQLQKNCGPNCSPFFWKSLVLMCENSSSVITLHK